MSNPIENLNKTFDSRVRLGIMSTLMVNDQINFNDLKQLIGVTDGNLASHIKALEETGYLKVNKGFVGRKTNTTYAITKLGEKSFQQHLAALEKMSRGPAHALAHSLPSTCGAPRGLSAWPDVPSHFHNSARELA
jgi:DNA-binding HxlR family transcriptional regulator